MLFLIFPFCKRSTISPSSSCWRGFSSPEASFSAPGTTCGAFSPAAATFRGGSGGLSLFMSFFSAGTFVVWGSIAYTEGWTAVTIQWMMAGGGVIAGLLIAPPLEPHGLPHGRRVHHAEIRRPGAEILHRAVSVRLALFDGHVPLLHRPHRRNGRRHLLHHEYPGSRTALHPLRGHRRLPGRRGDRCIAVPDSHGRRGHRPAAGFRTDRRHRHTLPADPRRLLPPCGRGIYVGFHARLAARQRLLAGRQLGLRPALHERRHPRRSPQNGAAVRRPLPGMPRRLDAAADAFSASTSLRSRASAAKTPTC